MRNRFNNKYLKILLSLALSVIMLASAFSLFGCKNSNSDDPIYPNNHTAQSYGDDDDDDETTLVTSMGTSTGTDTGTNASTETETGIGTGNDTEITGESESTGVDTEGETSDTSNYEEETEEEIVETDITLFENGETDFTIVVANSISDTISGAATQLKDAFSSKLDISINIKDEDYYKLVNNNSLKGRKIVVGTLSGDSISEVLERPLRDGAYVIKVTDGSLYIIGGTDETTAQAVTYFVNAYLKSNTDSIEFEPGVIYEKAAGASISNMTISGNEVWKYDIVYCDSVFAKECADKVRAAIANVTGYTLPIYSDSASVGEYEILVGKTNRDESKEIRDNYSRPNVYYDITTVGEKLVIMGEGYATLNKVAGLFEGYVSMMSEFGASINSSVRSGNILDTVDSEAGESMVERTEGTDLRVLHWNITAPYLSNELAVYDDNEKRGEVVADIILQLYPDVFTTNEFFKLHNGDSTMYKAVMGELGEYYTILDSDYELDKPAEGAKPIEGKTINSNIMFKKETEMSVVWSGWRYSTEKTDVTEDNPDGWVYYHGYHSAVLETVDGQKFIISVAHNADSKTESKWCEEHVAAVADAQAASGSSEVLPSILTGDMYTFVNSGSQFGTGYRYLQEQGYSDSQTTADVNANSDEGCRDSDRTKHGTFHDIGVREVTRAAEDFVWYKDGLSALRFKVLVSKDTDETSDHYPVISDLKFD